MTDVNFYTLSSEDEQSRMQFACRLAEKAVSLGHRVFLQVDNSDIAQQLNGLLWEYKPASFLPHVLAPEAGKPGENVTIGTALKQSNTADVLINLSRLACEKPDQFKKINEILSADPDILATGRASYRTYQSLGCTLETHKL